MSGDVLTLRWTCATCGWHVVINAPGFGGDGRYHYPDGRTACGPLTAQRTSLEELFLHPAEVKPAAYHSGTAS